MQVFEDFFTFTPIYLQVSVFSKLRNAAKIQSSKYARKWLIFSLLCRSMN